MVEYLISKSSHLKIKHSQLENCTLNCGVKGSHQMRQRYEYCKCSTDTKCPLTFKVNYCQKSQHIVVFEEHDKLVDCISKGKIDGNTTKPTRGVATLVREMIEEMCRTDPDDTPKKILTKLISQRKKSSCFDKSLIPKLSQVLISLCARVC